MEPILEILLYVWEYVKALLTTPQNAGILAASWVVIWMLTPLVEWFVAMPLWSGPVRLSIYGFFRAMKNIAAVMLCSGFVWIPHAQPDICSLAVGDPCQYEIERVITGLLLGGFLSLAHKWGATKWRKYVGKEQIHRFICANCRKTIDVEYTADPCPKCGKPHHEVTRK